MIDLHCHTTASDGEFSPSALIEYAVKIGLKAIAITDHDTIQGLEEAQEASKKFTTLQFIKGIELNIPFASGEFHLLGLGLKNTSSIFALLEEAQTARFNRNKKIINLLNDNNIKCSMEEIIDFAKEITKNPILKNLTRPHIASFLVHKGMAQSRQNAFDLYLARGRPFYVANQGVSLQNATKAIKESGGVAVLAHPISLHVSWGHLNDLLPDFYNQGVQGIEAWHPSAKENESLRFEELAKKYGFFITAGSDFHGPQVRPERLLGHITPVKPIEDRFLKNLPF